MLLKTVRICGGAQTFTFDEKNAPHPVGLGTILADRPKSVLVHSETHGMSLLRYVHNNPVRAGVVERASDSNGSSHRTYLGLEDEPSWLATEAVFGPDEGGREHWQPGCG